MGHTSITLAWHDSTINTWLQQVYWPSHYNLLKDLVDQIWTCTFKSFQRGVLLHLLPSGLDVDSSQSPSNTGDEEHFYKREIRRKTWISTVNGYNACQTSKEEINMLSCMLEGRSSHSYPQCTSYITEMDISQLLRHE